MTGVDSGALLAAYDEQLRRDAELVSAIERVERGPLLLGTYRRGRGFITYRDLTGVPADGMDALVAGALEHYRADPAVRRVEWKTRGHDQAPGLHEALLRHGFVPHAPESVMVGEARLLAVDVAAPVEVTIRQVTATADVDRMLAMQAEVFGDSPEFAAEIAEQVHHRLATRDDMEMWVAEAAGEVVSAGRLEPVAGTEFAGIWGGATRPHWRGRGIYRALTAARARSAIAHGKRLIHSDSTEFSRPILERSGLVKVTTTTPYEWRRPSR
ncbi:MAG: GNAT family N-acetyltransferase [Tetrasphaera sp.]